MNPLDRKMLSGGAEIVAIAMMLVWLIAGCGSTESGMSPAVVVGGSMEPTLHGDGIRSVCGDCGFPVTRDPDAESRAYLCPNCGVLQATPSQFRIAADQVAIDSTLEPDRWSIVAFERQRDAGSLTDAATSTSLDYRGVKRLVGLGGEIVSIHSGDVFIDGQIARKGMALQKSLRIPVYDSTYVSNRAGSRQRNWSCTGQWQLAGGVRPVAGEVAFAQIDSPERRVSWLTYRHRRNFEHTGNEEDFYPVEDYYIFNQLRSQQMNSVHDLYFEAGIRSTGGAAFSIRISRVGSLVELNFDERSGAVSVFLDEVLEGEIDLGENDLEAGREFEEREYKLEISTFDRQLIIAIDGRELFSSQLVMDAEAKSEPYSDCDNGLFAVGLSSGEMSLNYLKIWRDIYYRPPAMAGPQPMDSTKEYSVQLGGNEIFVLGDNVPISIDSRSFRRPLSRSHLLGVVRPAAAEE